MFLKRLKNVRISNPQSNDTTSTSSLPLL